MKKFTIYLIASLLCFPAISQYQIDVGASVGGSNYLGEMGGDQGTRRDFIWDMKLPQTSWSAGIFGRMKFNEDLGVKVAATWARIQGDDALSSNPGRRGRNLNFRNDLVEVSARGEYYFYETYDVGGYGHYLLEFRPYVFGGVAGVYSNPKAEVDGEYIALRPLKTEGQEKAYSPVTFSMPAGLGFYFTYDRQYRFGWELGYRHTFTDYLDDVSTTYASDESIDTEIGQQLANRRPELENAEGIPSAANYEAGEKRGDASHNDAYLISEFYFSYVIKNSNRRYTWIGGGSKFGTNRRHLRLKYNYKKSGRKTM